MATKTSLLGLTKPAASESADISVLNNNFDLIDTFLKSSGIGAKENVIDSLDNARAFGVYKAKEGTPTTSGVYWTALVLPSDGSNAVQIAYRSSLNPTVFAVRRMTSGEWGAWEYMHPAMGAGTEYATTERWGGKTVYRKRISYVTTDVGTAGCVTVVSIPHGISGLGEVVRIGGKVSSTSAALPLPYMGADGKMTVITGITASNVQVRTFAAWSGERTWTVDISYTKTA